MPEGLDFQSAEAGALTYLQGAGEGGTNNTPAPDAGASGSTGETGQQVPAGTQGQPAQGTGTGAPVNVPDDALVELVVNGQKVMKPWKQARNEMMLHEDYTRKRQAESEEVRQAREIVQSVSRRDAAYKELISDPKNIQALYETVTGKKITISEAKEIQKAGDELATHEDIQRTREELKKETGEVVQSALQELQDNIFVANIKSLTDSTITAVLDENKELNRFYGDEASGIIRRMARAKQPADAEELKAALVEAGQTLSKRVKEQLQEIHKESAVKQTKLTKQGIEPPGGAGVPAEPKSYTKGREVKWGDIDKDVEAFMTRKLNQ